MGSSGISAGGRRTGGQVAWEALRLLCMLCLAAIFAVSSIGKFARPKNFLGSVMDFRLLPHGLDTFVAVTLPGVELALAVVLGVGFLVGLARLTRASAPGSLDSYVEAAGWISGLLMIAFMAGMSVDILRGMKLDCGCFDLIGSSIPFLKSSHITWSTVGRDLAMLLLVVPVVVRRD